MFEFLFKYRPLAFEEGVFAFRPTAATYVATLLVVAAAVVTLRTYRQVRANSRPVDRGMLTAIRFAILALLVVCLWRPVLVLSQVEPQQNFLGILVDDSRSMQIADVEGESRADVIGRELGDESPLLAALRDRFAVRLFGFSSNTDRVGGPFMVMLRSPEMMNRARNVGDYVRFRSALPPRLSEFVILLTARHWTQNYEWYVHAPIAVREGLDAAVVEAVAEGRRPEGLAADEAAVYDFCMELLRNHGVSDPTYARMVSHLGEKGVIDAIGILGYYQMLAMVMNTARTPLPDGVEPGLPAFPR